MKLKSQIEQELREAKQALAEVKKIPCGYLLFYCPSCGNPVLLNQGQYSRRLDKGREFFCSANHSLIFKKQH